MEPEKSKKEGAAIKVLLKQYEFLRDEVIQSIYLKHIAILGLYTFLGWTVVILIERGADGKLLHIVKSIREFAVHDLTNTLNLNEMIFYFFTLIFVQMIVNGFGSLYLKEHYRNRRACSFLIAIEELVNRKIEEIGIYWENYITSRFIKNYKINPKYYKNRLLGVGLPVFLPNFFITLVIGVVLYAFYGKGNIILLMFFIFLIGMTFLNLVKPASLSFSLTLILKISVMVVILCAFYGKGDLILLICFLISAVITFFWASVIMCETYRPLRKEETPTRDEVLVWLEIENLELL